MKIKRQSPQRLSRVSGFKSSNLSVLARQSSQSLLAIFQFSIRHGGGRFDFLWRPVLTAPIGVPGATLEALRITIFTAGLELRQAMEPPDVLSASEPMPLGMVITILRSLRAT
jgi:hypothetical protein